jgi:hypothetical protein
LHATPTPMPSLRKHAKAGTTAVMMRL